MRFGKIITMKKFLLFLAVVFAASLVQGQASLNMTLAGHLTNPGALNDCWGWVDNTGKEYAIIGIQSGGVGIVDVSVPASPNLLFTVPGVPSLWRDIKTHTNYAYVVNDDGGAGGIGLLIIDLSGLPNTINYKDTIISNMEYSHNLYIDDGYAYLVGNNNNPGINIYDLADPWKPVQVGQYTATYVHDVYVRNNLAYSCELSNGLTIIDVTNKSNPQVLGNRQYINNFTHNSWLSDNGNVCFTTDETNAGWVYAWDVSDPQNITYLDGIRASLSGGASIPHNTHVFDDFLFTSYYRDGINVVDAQYPYNLIEVGYYDTSPLSGGGFDGNWGAYPFFPSGNVIASDMQSGLYIFSPAYTRACYLEGDVTDASNNQPIPGATITVQSQNWGSNTDNVGFYATGTPTPGTYTVTYSAFGYQDSTISVAMTNGTLIVRDIPLQPAASYAMTINVVEQGTNAPVPNAKVAFQVANGPTQNFTANANGQVTDPAFISANYNVIAGQWGWRTREVSYNGSSSNPSLTIELPVGYYDDFALDFGWTATGTANSGGWERGEPIGTYDFQGNLANPEVDIATDISDECYVTGNGGGGVGNDDIDGGIVVLESPVMDLSGYQEPFLKYYRWFFNEGGNGSPNDSLVFEISNGLTTVQLKAFDNTFNVWGLDTFTLSQFIAPTANMVFRVRAGDYPQGHVVEAGFDGFEVTDKVLVTAAEPLEETGEFTIFPNPLDKTTTVRYQVTNPGSGELTFELSDLLGRKHYQRELTGRSGEFNLQVDLPSGVYFGVFRQDGTALETIRVVK